MTTEDSLIKNGTAVLNSYQLYNMRLTNMQDDNYMCIER